MIKRISSKYPSRISIFLRSLVTVLPMPKLSPSNINCKLLKWHVKEGHEVKSYALVCEIETNTLQTTQPNQNSIMEIEIQEDCYVQKLLCREGEILTVGKPIAILVEEKDELSIVTDDIKSISDVYNQSKYQMAGWQAYVKNKNDPGQCGCS